MWWLFLEKKADKYFSARKNSMREGYRILGGPAPRPEDINITTVEESGTPFVRHVLNLFRKERILDGEYFLRVFSSSLTSGVLKSLPSF
jgi:hypothetical protein